MIRRPPRSTPKPSSAASDVYKRQTLSPAQVFTSDFENARAKIESGSFNDSSLLRELFGSGYVDGVGYIGFDNIHIISTEIRGDDLVVQFVFFNNFVHANLENANFKNAGLWFVNFNSANLTNADLSGADLRNASLDDADLSNANLDGAILDGAVLTCKNHPVCN